MGIVEVLFKKGCSRSCGAVILLDGSHFRHSAMKSNASLGQLGNTFGKEI